MLCALGLTDTRLQSASHIPCNRSFSQTIGNHFSKGQLIRKPASVHPENRDTASTTTIPPLGDSDWKPAPFLSGVQEVNEVGSLTSGGPDTEGLELLPAHPRILYWLGEPNERTMHDQPDSSKLVFIGNPHGGNTLKQSRHRKNVSNSLSAVPHGHVVAKKSSRAVTDTLRSDSDILHNEDKPTKRSPKKKGSKKRSQCSRTTRKKLNLASEENTCAVSPVEVLPTNLLADKLSEITSSASSLVKEAHLGKEYAENNYDYVECGTMLNFSSLGTDEVDGSECTGSSNDAAGERLSCSCVPYLSNGSNTTDTSECNGSTFAVHGLGEESNIYLKLLCPCVYNPDSIGTSFSRWNTDSNGSCNIGAEARLTIKDEYICNHMQPGLSKGLNDSFGCSFCCSKDVTDTSSRAERVQCSSEACSSKTSLQFSSGRRKKSRKTASYSDLTVSKRVVGARYRNGGKDSSAVWQKVERNDKTESRGERKIDSPMQVKGAQEYTNKGVQQDPTTQRVKHNQSKKACKQESSNEIFEMESTKVVEEALNSCQISSKSIYMKQAPFPHQQRISSSHGSLSLKNYYACKNGIPKVPKDYSQQERLPRLQLAHVKDTGDRATLNSFSADEVILSRVGSTCRAEGNESSQSGIEKAALSSRNLVPDLAPQAASSKAHISIAQEDSQSLCPENKGTSTSWSSRNLCTDPCAAETEEARFSKLTTENNPQECCKTYIAAGHLSQKWVPVGKKEASNLIHIDVSEASVSANDISDSVGPESTSYEDRKLASELTSKPNSCEHNDLKCRSYNGTDTGYNKITEAVSDVYIAQQRVEDVQLRIGRPLADFEEFIYYASPAVHCSPCPTGCKSYLQECVKDGLCLHQTPDITLSSVWHWYEEPCCYGLEIKAHDFHRSKGLWNSQCQFTTYFVPYLSAVQLFGQPKRTSGGSSVKEAIDMSCETSPYLNTPPIFAKLIPQESKPRHRSSTLHTEAAQQSASADVIFEYFESEQPYCRRQLFDKVNELIAGVKPSNCQISGDPKNLELSLHDLHPASWYSVAWYPIYRIPDGKFQTAFLTYHSVGHWVHQSSTADRAVQATVALPVIGLQSYNNKAEWWFQMSKSDSEGAESAGQSRAGEASQVLKERLRTLHQAASVMSRAEVVRNDGMSRNRHPDYEFFLSRS